MWNFRKREPMTTSNIGSAAKSTWGPFRALTWRMPAVDVQAMCVTVRRWQGGVRSSSPQLNRYSIEGVATNGPLAGHTVSAEFNFGDDVKEFYFMVPEAWWTMSQYPDGMALFQESDDVRHPHLLKVQLFCSNRSKDDLHRVLMSGFAATHGEVALNLKFCPPLQFANCEVPFWHHQWRTEMFCVREWDLGVSMRQFDDQGPISTG
jgi:hypothetical protein